MIHRLVRPIALASVALAGAGASAQTVVGHDGLQKFEPLAPRVASEPERLMTPSIDRIGIDSFTRLDVEQALPVEQRLATVINSNGPLDNVTAHLSQLTSIGDFLAADDYFIKAGEYHFIDAFTFCFLVSDSIDGIMTKPTFELKLYPDCDGRPDSTLMIMPDATVVATNLGPSAFAGFNLWQVRFAFDEPLILGNYLRFWLSPRGVGDLQDGLYYWLSANNGIIQGAQAQLKNGAEPWMDVQDCDCPGICTDLCYTAEGHVCCIVHTYFYVDVEMLGGAKSLQLKGATIDTARAVDNFQIPLGASGELCYVSGIFATNCPLDKLFFEVYENVCNMPGAKLYSVMNPPVVNALTFANGDPVLFNGCQVYSVYWPKLHGILLVPGRDYWISLVAKGTGSILDKAFWLFVGDEFMGAPLCDIQITEGKVKDPFVPGLEDFTFVSVATGGPPRDFTLTVLTHAGPTLGGQGDSESPPTEGGAGPTSAILQGSQTFAAPLPR